MIPRGYWLQMADELEAKAAACERAATIIMDGFVDLEACRKVLRLEEYAELCRDIADNIRRHER